MVNVKTPLNPVHKRVPSEWPPKDGREYRVLDTDDWWKIAAREHIDPWALIIFNFDTTVPEEVNWYLRELVGCRHTKDRWNYAFLNADKSKGKIYLPPAPLPPPKPVPIPWYQKLKKLEYEVQHSNDPDKSRFLCMLDAMKNRRDDRVIFWDAIAPNKTAAPMWITRGLLVDEQWLYANIKTWQDVLAIPYGDGSDPKRFVLSLHKVLFETGDGSLFALRWADAKIFETDKMLDLWANSPVGGSSGMPPPYRAIREFVKLGKGSPGSVMNCLVSNP